MLSGYFLSMVNIVCVKRGSWDYKTGWDFTETHPICDEADTSQVSNTPFKRWACHAWIWSSLLAMDISSNSEYVFFSFPTLVFQPAEMPERKHPKTGIILETKPKFSLSDCTNCITLFLASWWPFPNILPLKPELTHLFFFVDPGLLFLFPFPPPQFNRFTPSQKNTS